MARPFGMGATGGPGLLLQAGPITPTRRRDVPLSMCRWKNSVDDVLQRHGTPSQANLPVLTKLLEPAIKRWTLREVSMYGDTSISHFQLQGDVLEEYLAFRLSRRGHAGSPRSSHTSSGGFRGTPSSRVPTTAATTWGAQRSRLPL